MSAPARPFLTSAAWDPDVRERLEQLVAEPGDDAPVAAFDFDQTCAWGDVSETLLRLLARDRGVDLVGEYEAACARDLRAGYVELVYTLIGGRTEREARAAAERALREGVDTIQLREPIRELVWAMHRFGWQVWVVTASAEVLVQAAAERLGIHPHRVIGMRAPLDPSGRYRAEIVEPIPFRQGKLELLRRAIGRDPTFAAGDSRSDAWMMRAARHALLLDRGDEALRREMTDAGALIQPAEQIR
ncbi:MAG: haloacid dehalogenase-like hydrolase [Myxococcota bacterium]